MTDKKEIYRLFNRAKKLIDTSEINQKKYVERYICLLNRRINILIEKGCDFGIVGASWGIRNRFEGKFGEFIYRNNPVN